MSNYMQDLFQECGRDEKRSVAEFYARNEYFDGEPIIGTASELRFRQVVGLPTADCERRLAEAEAYEADAMRRYSEGRR